MTAAPANQNIPPLAKPVTALWGVGAERADQLARLKISTVEDLLLHRPRRYEDRRHFRPIVELQLDEPATTRGTVVALGVKRFRHGQKSVFELILDDGTARLHCRWWNLPFLEKYFHAGDEVVVFGKPLSLKPRTMDHPETEVVETGGENFIHLNRITPVYPLTEGLPQRWLRSLIWRTLEQFESKIVEPWPELHSLGVGGSGARLSSPPAQLTAKTARKTSMAKDAAGAEAAGNSRAPFPSRANAIHMLHFPEEFDDVEMARQRLALDEFIELQLQIQLRRKKFQAKAQALPCGGDNHLIKPFLAALGFKLTGSQTNVLREIRADLRGAHPMRRLLQGDVGSGKTVVAACSALMVMESGYGVALMAPTEILAEQHFQNFNRWFAPLGARVELQTGSRKTASDQWRVTSDAAKRPVLLDTRHPSRAALVIGTHALLTAGFELPDLGLVIIDEQHKFGVAQREQLVRKGRYPHLLVMTATPIPRTLGLTLYGELDVSTIDESPPGRGRIKTFVRTADKLPKVWTFVREQLAAGRQAYVVYPRVEETDQNSVKAVTKEFESLQRMLAPFRVGLLHGRLRGKEKDEVMAAFRAGTAQVLLATSLIEVGVDVPNATVMLIENAEQFSLAQLHQLRGRIGRGARDSYCILVSAAMNEEAQRRLDVLGETTDGFRIAEADLKLRGPGELLGQQQSGMPDFRFGDLGADWELIKLARQRAVQLAGK
jgi:ATP-dependent DNA helicase RecG